MELNAYTFSDVLLVTRILSQIAMIFDGGAFDVAAKTAAVIGLIVALFVGVFKGGQFSMATFFWPIMVAVLMLMPKVDLVVEDKNGGLSRVDDLPIGFAAPISIITTMGAAIGDLLTQNLGLEDNAITLDNGHLLALRSPIIYRQVITEEAFQGPASTFPNGLSPVKDTIIYVDKCLKPQDKLPGTNTKYSRIQSRDFSSFRVGGSGIAVPASNGQAYECETHYDMIMEGFESAGFQQSLNEAINQHFSKYQNDTTTGPRYLSALESVIPDPPRFYAAIAWSNAVQQAPAYIVGAAGGGSHQAALTDALNQRREKNYGTAAIVFETIATTISFIEVWSLSIMPLVLLLMMIGPLGAKTAAKYFWMLVWVQFWYPTLLIVMGFLDASLDAIGMTSFITIGTLNAFMSEVMRLQDVGYMYLSMATALSMFLVFGTSSALATSMQRDMSGGDHYDPKKNAPDTLRRDPVNVMQSAYNYSPMAGGTAVASDASMLGAVRVSLGHGVSSTFSASEVAAFAGQGSVAISTGYGTTTGQNRMNSVTNSAVAADAKTVSSGAQISFGTSMDAGTNVTGDRTASVGSSTSLDRSAAGGIQGSFGGGTGMLGGGAKGGINVGGGASMQWSDNYREGDNNKLGYNLGSEINTGTSGRVDGSRSLSESDTKSTVETVGASSANQKSDNATQTNSAAWTDSESETRSKQEMVYQSASQEFLLTDVARLMGNNTNAMSMTKQAVMDARLNGEVENFMAENQSQLGKLFTGQNAGEASYAFAAHYVMQGMGNTLYADDTENGVARREAINAVSDDIMRFAGLGVSSTRANGPELENLQSFQNVDPNSLKNAYMGASQGYRLDADTVKSAIRDVDPTMGNPSDVLEQMERRIGAPFENMTTGQLNGVLSEVSQRIEEQHGPIDADRLTFAESLKEQGFTTAFYGALVGGQNGSVRDFGSKYEDLAYSSGAQYPDVTTGDSQEVQRKADTMLANYLDGQVADGTIGGATDVAKYMSLSGLSAQAAYVGDEVLASRFSGMMKNMEDADPILQDPDTSTKLQALGAAGFTNREYMRGVAEYRLGALTEQLTHQSGKDDLNSSGIGVQWTTTPSSVPRGAMNGGGTTLPEGSKEDILLSFVGSLEAPKGYDQFENASAKNPPPEQLTSMTIGEVMQWQDNRIMGAETRAAGRYQLTGGSDGGRTFVQAMRGAGLDENDRFTPENQDSMGVYLLNQRGLGSLNADNADQFAHELSKEWAILPQVTGASPNASFYQGVQGNKSGVSPDTVRTVLDRAISAPSANSNS